MINIFKYKKVFRLHDEIGECPNIITDTEVTDKSPFFVLPFPKTEEDKTNYGLANVMNSIFRHFVQKKALVIFLQSCLLPNSCLKTNTL